MASVQNMISDYQESRVLQRHLTPETLLRISSSNLHCPDLSFPIILILFFHHNALRNHQLL